MQPYHLYHKVFEERADAAEVCKLSKLANSWSVSTSNKNANKTPQSMCEFSKW